MPNLPRALGRLNREALIPRDELGEALICCREDSLSRLGKMLLSRDDKFSKLTIGGLAHRLGVSYPQIMQAYTAYKREQAVVAMAREMPAIAADIAEDAKNKTVTCAACEGTGSISAGTDKDGETIVKRCIPCEGKGTVRQRGDKDARKMALEIMEIAGRGVTNIDARGGQVAVVQGGESLEEMLKKARATRQTARAEVADGRHDRGAIDMDSSMGQADAGGAV